jgi:hypothetical protein
LFVLALVIFAVEAARSPLLDAGFAVRQRYIAAATDRGVTDGAAEATAAAAYWARYQDVAADGYYGRGGPLGAFGARQHYLDHGRREGRQWGP